MVVLRTATAFVVGVGISNVFAAPIGSTGPQDLAGVKVTVPPKIDGDLSPGEWPAEARKEGFVDKDTNSVSDERAEFWVTYDKDAIYFAAKIKTDPSKIVANEFRPNTSFSDDDNIGLAIDPISNGSQGNIFRANSRGATSIQLAGGRAAKTEWLGEILASGKKTEDGWQCEIRIPWGVMSLPAAGTKSIPWNVYWFRSNKNNTYAYKYFGQDISQLPMWTGIDVPNVERHRELKLLPYVYGGYGDKEGVIANGGLDFKTGLTDTLTFVGTVNPDFRNIETSVLSLDHSYFERLADDGRPFFQEGAGYLSTGHDQRLFASQRIKAIDGGAKLYGQLNSQVSLGFLTTFDFGKQRATALSTTIRPTGNDSINFAYVGNDQPGLRNDAMQLNFSKTMGPWLAYFNNQGTMDQVKGDGYRNSTGAMYLKNGWSFGVDHHYVSKNFFPRLGFSPEQDLRGVSIGVGVEQTPSKGPFSALSFAANALTYNRNDGSFYRDDITLESEIRLKNKWAIGTAVTNSKFLGSTDYQYIIGAGYIADNDRYYAVNYHWGEFAGSPYQKINVELGYRPTARSVVSWTSNFQKFMGSDTQHFLSLRYDIGTYESIGGRAVFENGEWNWYLSYRMSGKKGVEYFVLVGDPQANSFQNRLVIKAVIPISVKY